MRIPPSAVLLGLLSAVGAAASGLVAVSAAGRLGTLLQSVDDLPTFGDNLAVALAILAAALAIIAYLHRRNRRETASSLGPDVIRRHRVALIRNVRESWIQGVLTQSLYAIAQRDLQLEKRPLKFHLRGGNKSGRVVGSDLRQTFEVLGKQMMILGEPGTGKTTLLLELTRSLLPATVGVDETPIPVVFSLSGWPTENPPLEDWLTSELTNHYAVAPGVAKLWTDAGRVIPMLDGLDEVAPGLRRECLSRIHEYRRGRLRQSLVLTCREAEYDALGVGDEIPALVAEKLDRSNIEAYLARSWDRLGGMRKALHADPSLWEAIDTPLMLSVAAFALQNGLPENAPNSGDARTRLLDMYVDRMIGGKAPSLSSSGRKVRRWLTQLAGALVRTSRTTFRLDEITPDWLPPDAQAAARFTQQPKLEAEQRRRLQSYRRRIEIAVYGPMFGLAFGLLAGPLPGVLAGLIGILLWLISTNWAERRKSLRAVPNQGLRMRLRTAAAAAFLPVCLAGLTALSAAFLPESEGPVVLTVAGAYWLGAWGVAITRGGGYCLGNLALRCLIWRSGCAPLRYLRFLDDATKKILLQRVGDGYRFMHPVLMEHLARQESLAESRS